MKKILISEWVPQECLIPYEKDFVFTVPTQEKKLFSYNEIYNVIDDYDGYLILDNKADKRLIDKGHKLRVIANFGVGYDNIDWKYATQKGILVVNTPTTVTETTAEHTIALIMSTMRGIVRYDKEVRKSIWNSPNFSNTDIELHGKVLGIIGFGRIGKRVAYKANGLGMKIIYYDKYRASKDIEDKYNVKYMELCDVIKNSDCITLHMPYLPENHHIFSKKVFDIMKKSAYLVNASRGPLVNETDLIEALKSKKIKGAALDVFENEPDINKEFFLFDNVVLTPHIASCTLNTRIKMCNEALYGIVEVLKGNKPNNVIN